MLKGVKRGVGGGESLESNDEGMEHAQVNEQNTEVSKQLQNAYLPLS